MWSANTLAVSHWGDRPHSRAESSRLHPTAVRKQRGGLQPAVYFRPGTASCTPLPILTAPRVLHPDALTPMSPAGELRRVQDHLATTSRPSTVSSSRPATAQRGGGTLGSRPVTPRLASELTSPRSSSLGSPRTPRRGYTPRAVSPRRGGASHAGGGRGGGGGAPRRAQSNMSSWVQSHAGAFGELTYRDWSSPDVLFDLIDTDGSGSVTKSEVHGRWRPRQLGSLEPTVVYYCFSPSLTQAPSATSLPLRSRSSATFSRALRSTRPSKRASLIASTSMVTARSRERSGAR